jgi:SPW repeat
MRPTNGRFIILVESCSARRQHVKDIRMTAATARWQDWASFVLGLWLALSPWLVGYSENEAATANAVFVGLALALGAHFEATFDELGAQWLNIAGGLWLLLAPFVVGFNFHAVATANSIAVGTLVIALAASAMSLDKEIGKWWHNRFAGR